MAVEGKDRQRLYVQNQKARGLVEVRAWVTPEQHKEIMAIINGKKFEARMKHIRTNGPVRTLGLNGKMRRDE